MAIINKEPMIDFNQVLITPRRSTLNSRKEVDIEREFNFSRGQSWRGVPIITANMATTGTLGIYKEVSKYKMLTCLHKFHTLGDLLEYNVMHEDSPLNKDFFIVSTGIRENDFENLCNICDNIETKWICIDVANGYIPNLITYCKKVRMRFPNHIIIAGNVATGSMASALCEEGDVDIIKVGIGPGCGCTTRLKTGVGIPQLSCIMDCAKEVHKFGKYIIGDGGITCPGDMSKAFCGGADFVMMGGVFAGHIENPGDIIEKTIDGIIKKFKLFYGMSSTHAMMTHYGKKDSYRSSEGRVVEIPLKGLLKDTIEDYLGGLRSTCTYIDASCIGKMSENTVFVMVQNQLNTSYAKYE